MTKPFTWSPFDGEPYDTVYQRQKALVEERIQGRIPDTLLLGEHPHVITLGRGSHQSNLLETASIPVVEIERGGDVTYHGPGQLIGYPVFQLEEDERDLHQYLRNLEEMIIRVLAVFNLYGTRRSGWTGVWVGDKKVASIGVAVKKWVTYHGFALNVTTDLDQFRHINPCGLPSTVMTSIAALLPHEEQEAFAMARLQKLVLQETAMVFNRTLVAARPESQPFITTSGPF